MTTEEKRKRDLLLALFLLLSQDTFHTLTARVLAYMSGSAGFYVTADTIIALLMDAHAHAAYLGRRLAGKRQPFGRSDAQFASVVMAGQARYLRKLMSDLFNRRYELTDDELPPELLLRLGLYVRRLRGTANQAWALSLPADTLIHWRLTPGVDHCDSCLEYARNSPYKASELPAVPGGSDCTCLANCRCRLELEDGTGAFVAVEELAE